MRLKVFLFFLATTLIFFYPVLKGQIPFPGDLVVSHYEPWRSYSFLGYSAGGVPHKAQGIDVARQLFPWKYFSMKMIKSGELPLWNPYNFSGNPHLANFQTGVFYPLNLLFLILPFNLAWTLFILSQTFLAGLFTYLLARELRLSRLAGFFSGLAFAFCLYFTVWVEYGNIGQAVLWLPLSLLLIEKIVKEFKLKWIVFLIFAFVFSLLAGYIQATIYLFGATYLYFFFRLLTTKRREKRLLKAGLVLGAGLIALLLCSFQLLPTWEIFQASAREAYPPEKIPGLLLPWFYLLTLFVPDFFGNPASRNYWLPGTYIERVSYIGVLPLFFALLALIKKERKKLVFFFALLAGLALLFSLNLGPIRFFYGLKIPIISTTVYTRLLVIFSFFSALLAGFGIDIWLKSRSKKKPLALLIAFGGVYFFLWLFTLLASRLFSFKWWLPYLGVIQRNLILPTAFFLSGALLVFLASRFPKKLLFWGIMGITLFDLFFYFHKITPFSPTEFVYPSTSVFEFLQKEGGINRFWGYGLANIDTNFSTFNQTFSSEGNDPLFIQRHAELSAAASNHGVVPREIPRADVFIPKGFGPEEMKANPYRQQLLNLLGVKYILHKDEWLGEKWQPDYTTFSEQIYKLIWQDNHWQIYENQLALPRLFLAGDYQLETNHQKISRLIFDPSFPLRGRIILEEPLPSDFVLDKDTTGEIEELNYQPNKIEMKVKASGNSLLFLSDNYFPGWQAFVDGQETKIYRADYAFRAIALSKGEHRVVFNYQPQSFQSGLIISGATLLLTLAGFIIMRRFL